MSFWISEMDQRYTVEFKASDVAQLLFLNLIWSPIAWWVYTDAKKAAQTASPAKSFSKVLDIAFFALLCFFVMSNSSHVIVNRINGKLMGKDYIKEVLVNDPTHGMSVGYLLIYWYDEYLGHLGMMAPLFLGQCILLYFQLHTPQEFKQVPLVEKILFFILGAGNGLYNSYSLVEGQANIPLLVMHLLLLVTLIALLISKKYPFKSHPIMWFLFLQIAGFVIYSIIWIALTGLKPYYPFTYQPSELNKPWF